MARRSQGDRNAQAQRRLRELGHDPGALRGAEYRLRVAQGRAQGLSTGQAVGKPLRGEQLVSRLRASGALPSHLRRAGRVPPRDTELATGRITNTHDQRYLAQQLRQAAARGERVAFRITGTGSDGRTRTRAIEGTTAQRQLIEGRALTNGTAGNHAGGRRRHKRAGETSPPENAGATVHGNVQLVTSSDPGTFGRAGDGFDPDDVLDWLDTYDFGDWWDAWADLWDTEYE